jgi:hypothetical protein
MHRKAVIIHRSRRNTFMTHHDKRRGAPSLSWLPVAATLALGCGAVDSAVEPAPTVASTSDVIVCRERTSIERREMYVLSGIHKKLRDYPEFASAIDVERVATCDEARAFMRSYHDYSDRHPGFDADQPLGPIEDIPPPPSGASATMEAQKLLGGTSGFLGRGHPQVPVVHLSRIEIVGDQFVTERCTGTLVAKNWITTAAHCLASKTVPPFGTNPTGLKGYTDYAIEFAAADGTFTGRIQSTGQAVLQLPDPRYMGESDTAHDFALLFLDKPTFDPKLPNPGDGAAMRVLTTPATLSEATFIAGTIGGQLRTAQLPSLSRTAATYASVVATTSQALCSGDSGGPLFQTPLVGGASTPVLLGTYVASVGSATPLGPNCPGVGDGLIWTRLDKTLPVDESHAVFIETHVEKWIGKCKNVSLPAGATAIQCWGDPCQIDSECPQTPVKHYCSKPHRSYAGACPICEFSPATRGTCECIQGQCLPKPPED